MIVHMRRPEESTCLLNDILWMYHILVLLAELDAESGYLGGFSLYTLAIH